MPYAIASIATRPNGASHSMGKTPSIAFRRGALPEIVQDSVNGWLVNGVDEAAGVRRSR
ncbi:hypothetical protein [Paraburkholderia sp. SIMBA_054]|uniref:hypothetical protein n=1 Tax=Paraburkholderia sp. SIMBA_054 TaxID=3085795 RepID=UPI00397D7C6B